MKRTLLVLVAAVCFLTAQAQNIEIRVPVLFVHGSGLDSSSWGAMAGHLRSLGYPKEYLLALDLLPADGDNVRAAEQYIAPAVTKLLHDARQIDGNKAANKVDIVAHSMGAVSSRWFATKMQPEKVRTLITLAGANHGTDALCGYAGVGNRQLCPAYSSRSVQFKLNGARNDPVDETPYGFGSDPYGVTAVKPDAARAILYVTLRIDPDEWILPTDSAELSGAGGVTISYDHVLFEESSSGNWLFRGDSDHDSLPENSEVIEWVTELLGR